MPPPLLCAAGGGTPQRALQSRAAPHTATRRREGAARQGQMSTPEARPGTPSSCRTPPAYSCPQLVLLVGQRASWVKALVTRRFTAKPARVASHRSCGGPLTSGPQQVAHGRLNGEAGDSGGHGSALVKEAGSTVQKCPSRAAGALSTSDPMEATPKGNWSPSRLPPASPSRRPASGPFPRDARGRGREHALLPGLLPQVDQGAPLFPSEPRVATGLPCLPSGAEVSTVARGQRPPSQSWTSARAWPLCGAEREAPRHGTTVLAWLPCLRGHVVTAAQSLCGERAR